MNIAERAFNVEAAARDGCERNEHQVEQQLDLGLGKEGTFSLPDQFRLLVAHEGGSHGLGVAGVDLHAGRTGCAEGDAGKLQPGRGVAGALPNQAHCVLVGTTLVEQF